MSLERRLKRLQQPAAAAPVEVGRLRDVVAKNVAGANVVGRGVVVKVMKSPGIQVRR